MAAAPRCELIEVAPGAGANAALRELVGQHEEAREASHVSRSYRAPLAAVAWHPERVGVDIERLAPLGPEFARSICTARERVSLGEQLADDALVASLWCGKEALAKALGDAIDYDPRRLDAPLLWPDGACGRWRANTVDVPQGHVCWLVWLG